MPEARTLDVSDWVKLLLDRQEPAGTPAGSLFPGLWVTLTRTLAVCTPLLSTRGHGDICPVRHCFQSSFT